jgi:hypothetical protein
MTDTTLIPITVDLPQIFEEMRSAIAGATTVDQAKRILVGVVGLAAAARQASNKEMVAEAATLKLEAERRLGQLMAAQKETIGLATGGDATRVARGKQNPEQKPTLAQAGIDKNLAKRARTAAEMPDEKFEEATEAKRKAITAAKKRHSRPKLSGKPTTTKPEEAPPEPQGAGARGVQEVISLEERRQAHARLAEKNEELSAKASVEDQRSDTNDDPLVIDRDNKIEATPWFSSKIKPIFDGSIKNDEVKSTLALTEFKRACATFLPQLTLKDLEASQDILAVISDLRYEVEQAEVEAKRAAADAKRIKWETANPEKAKTKAREQAQRDLMEGDMEEAKAEAKENGDRWGDIKDDWIDQWIADNWGAEQEAEFEKNFQAQWLRERGVTHEKV